MNSYSRTTETKCWTCGESGHTSRYCERTTPLREPQGKPEALVAKVFLTEALTGAKGGTTSGTIPFSIDTGSSNDTLQDKSFFTMLEPPSTLRKVGLCNDSTLEAHECGMASPLVQRGYKIVELKLQDALYVPEINSSLLSVSELADRGNSERILISNGQGRAEAECYDGLYILNVSRVSEPICLQTMIKDPEANKSLNSVHEALAHSNENRPWTANTSRTKTTSTSVIHVNRESFDAAPIVRSRTPLEQHDQEPSTTTCVLQKQHRSEDSSISYLTDEYSECRRLFALKTKDQIEGGFWLCANEFRNKFGRDIDRLLTDNGMEIISDNLKRIIGDIEEEHTTSNAPNACSKRNGEAHESDYGKFGSNSSHRLECDYVS